MLQNILESNKKTTIATFFLASPVRAFYVGELEKRLGKGVLPELSQMVKLDFLETFLKKGKRYYMVNERSNGYRDLKEFVLKSARSYEDELFKAVKKLTGVRCAVLMGVFAGYPNSECDLLLVGDFKEGQLTKLAEGLDSLMGQEVNYAVLSPDEFKYRKGTFDRFIKDVFENKHLVVVDNLKV